MNYIAYIVTAASIVGTVANSFQKRWCFWVWICTNTFWCVFNIVSGSYVQAILYAFNFIMAVVGLVKWRQKERWREYEKHFEPALQESINEAYGLQESKEE